MNKYSKYELELLLRNKLNRYYDVIEKIDKIEDNNLKRKYRKLIASSINIYSMFNELLEDEYIFENVDELDFGGLDTTKLFNEFRDRGIDGLKKAINELVEKDSSFKDLVDKCFKDIDMVANTSILDEPFEDAEDKAAAEDNPAPEPFVIEDGVLIKYLGDNPIVYVPKSVKIVGSMAFTSRNKHVKKVYFSDELVEFRPYAFYFTHNIEFVSIPNNVEKIGDYAFIGCMKLSDVFIPATVKYIGVGSFGLCTSVKTISISSNNENYYESRNSIISKKDNSVVSTVYHSIIPNNVSSIATGAFIKNNAHSVVIPEGIETIESLSFVCSELENITIPKNVKKICTGAFVCCNNLVSLTIESADTIVEPNAFVSCNALSEVIIPQSLAKEADKIISVGKDFSEIAILTY